MQIATIGGGCFWCIEAIYNKTKGVQKAISGYSGGNTTNPTYEDICQGNTGHIEVVEIRFDEQIISYKDILDIFFAIHNPTTLNQQGGDIGEQYASIIYFHNEAQKEIAQDTINKLNKQKFNGDIITRLETAQTFYQAEEYHQEYYTNNPNQGYCQMVITPKVNKFLQEFKELSNTNS